MNHDLKELSLFLKIILTHILNFTLKNHKKPEKQKLTLFVEQN